MLVSDERQVTDALQAALDRKPKVGSGRLCRAE
jgi:hypothetical protein